MKKPITVSEAKARNLERLTSSYTKQERAIMNRAIADIEKRGIYYDLVQRSDGIQIWRDAEGYAKISQEKAAQTSPPPFKERTI